MVCKTSAIAEVGGAISPAHDSRRLRIETSPRARPWPVAKEAPRDFGTELMKEAVTEVGADLVEEAL